MVKYTIQRLIMAFITAFIILSLTFFLVRLMPFPMPNATTDQGRYAYWMQQARYGSVLDLPNESANYGNLLFKFTDTAKITHYFYQKPIIDQYFAWVKGVFTKFEFGPSNGVAGQMAGVDAMKVIFGTAENSYLLTTIKVNIWPALISVPAGIGLGIWAALKKNKLTDHIISTAVMIFISVPSFIIITLLLMFFVYGPWGSILPPYWLGKEAPMSRRVLCYVIPTIALSFGSICGYCRFTRAELTEVMSSDFLLLARTKGLTRSQSITRHALKNAMVPILPSILSELIALLGGSMILEQMYGIPGVGKLYVQSLQGKGDYNVLMADMAFYTLIGLLSGVFLDLSYGFIDPRIRMGARK